MPFRFPLEAVFHFRKSVEHQHELRLRAANQQVARVRHVLEHLDQNIGQLRDANSRQLTAGTTSAEMMFALRREAAQLQQRAELERELARVENLRDQQQKIFRQARRAREIFESLRQHQLEAYQRETARREQRELDDLFLIRRAHSLRQPG
jgi:flagellar export protein FliJ